MISQPLAPLCRRAIAPITRHDWMIGIERLQIRAHLSQPRPALRPVSDQALGFVHQLVPKDGRIISIVYASDAVAPSRDFLDVLAIKTTSSLIGIKQHRRFFVDAERIFVVIGALDTGPTQVLRDAARVAPPVRQTELHAEAVTRGFGYNPIEKNELIFIPDIRLETKIVGARPVVKIADRLNVIWPAFARRPNAHDFDAQARSLLHSLRYARAIFVAIHHGHI